MDKQTEQKLIEAVARIDERTLMTLKSIEDKCEQDRIMFTQHDKRICELEEDNAAIKGKSGVISGIVSFIIGIFMWLLSGIDITKIFK